MLALQRHAYSMEAPFSVRKDQSRDFIMVTSSERMSYIPTHDASQIHVRQNIISH